MIGGGPGVVHHTAACLDGEIQLVCDAFSSDPEKSREMGKQLGLSEDRVYGSYKEMIEQEQKSKVVFFANETGAHASPHSLTELEFIAHRQRMVSPSISLTSILIAVY
ncbi:unnamed protein product [Adineta steineri]|uniref:Uncharacterized protein n=1 Tax=Adineta steineri TaxID=433720 RepID=A0A819WGU0_9BILA|nr:unnamed protein product [Adineta steineri]